MANDIPTGDVSTLSLVREVDKLVDENKVNERLKTRRWILIGCGQMMQVMNVREGNIVKKAIGQAPYYVIGRVEV